MNLEIVILAAGKGTRMKSDLPKVLHTLAGKPFLQHVIDTSSQLASDKIHIVVGHGAEKVQTEVSAENISFAMQHEQLGTGHAVAQAVDNIKDESTVLVLYGDVPLVKQETLQSLVEQVSESSMALLTMTLDNPFGYGRIVRDGSNAVTAIVEQKDATEDQLLIEEINTGILAIKAQHLKAWLPKLSNNNASGEYYLTDLIAMSVEHGVKVNTAQPDNELEVLGVNNRLQQAQLERYYQASIAEKLMVDGVTLIDPSRFDCRGSVEAGKDVLIDVNCVFIGNVSIGNNVVIEANCIIENASIGDNVTIKSNTVLEDVIIEADCHIGPFARLRPGSELQTGVRIGNFVEVKKSVIGTNSKVNHLSYIGDADIGEGCNIGAGTITCNYDGVNKFKTTIGDDVFIGTNNALIAPVSVGNGATTGAGSVITQQVNDHQLAVSRTRQTNIDGWKRPEKIKS